MKNKILISIIVIVLFVLTILTSSFVLLTNIQHINDTKEELKNFNSIIFQLKSIDKEKLDNIKINGISVRLTFINTNGDVLYDTEENNLTNNINTKEIQEALETGNGYAIRYNESTNTNLIYYATKIDDTIIRSSVPVNMIKMFQSENIKYYVCILIGVIISSIALSLKLVKMIIQPVKDLESITGKMAGGDYRIRVNVNTNDELGNLGNSFNNMANQLQMKINELVEKQTKIESILRSMESGVIAVDNNDVIISINPYAEKIFGIKKNIIGENLIDYITDYDINNFLKEEEIDKEIKILHPIERNLKIKKAIIVNGIEKIGKVITIQDITDLKKFELMRTQFVANVSHELKTPLTSIKGFAETLRDVEQDPTRGKFLDIINKEAERLTRLINDILVLSHIESHLVSQSDEFLPGVIIEDVINMIKKIAYNKEIKLEFEDHNQEFILGDKDKFFQLVLNLIENGIKYSESGACVKVLSYDKCGYYYLEVSDNGIGIPEEDLPRIFERFYRVDKSRKQGGTGLGLAIVKHIVKTFNGDINVESELGEGTTFKVEIKYL
ncbi:sensor histidine kinase [Clostridium uliginosum]|uniref:histidine kinase n=1 Tax=Clostridium uliginosum TaxID=119641 RepID=A0A1I1LG52_9CLOT|nr:ATP-binding protein [Clostridium uliginosum]SFC71955.1 two-component system, OmpR family, phosphate regulon sensor histidine kinase PhoR [Clostridium uliginosum]